VNKRLLSTLPLQKQIEGLTIHIMKLDFLLGELLELRISNCLGVLESNSVARVVFCKSVLIEPCQVSKVIFCCVTM